MVEMDLHPIIARNLQSTNRVPSGHPEEAAEDTTIASVMETLIEQGFDGMAEAVALLLN